jgi:hypothetical protein
MFLLQLFEMKGRVVDPVFNFFIIVNPDSREEEVDTQTKTQQ